MENYSKLLKNVALLMLFSLFPLVVYSQATADELLDGYVYASVNKENVSPYKTRINQIYKGYRQDQQAAFREKIYERIKGDTITEQNILIKKIALIDLYALFADSNDSKLDDLYFLKGKICGLHTGDTIMLKECITGLKLSDQSKTPKVTDYITTLQDYLEQIRNYLPASQRMDGIWVSEIIYNMELINKAVYYTPSFTINVNHGLVKMENTGYAIKFADIGFWSEKVKNDENTYAQSVVDIGKDKVYLVWSNEKLKIPNQAVALSLGQTAGDITTNAVSEATSSLIGNIGGNMIGGIAGNIIGGAIMDMFTPSKKIYVLEMELELINDYELVGHLCNQVIKIDGNGKPDISTEKKEIYFIKYDIKSGVYFGSSGNKYKYIPGYELSKEFPSQHKQMFTKLAEKYQKGLYSHINWNIEKFQSSFCHHQIRKLIFYDEQKMLNEGCKMSEKWHQFTKSAFLGVVLYPPKQNKKNKNAYSTNGAFVYDVEQLQPASLFGIKEGDIILSADGYAIKDADQLLNYIRSLKPYDWVKLHIKRGSKEVDIEVELSFSYSGRGKVTYDNGDIYEGEILDGKRNGWGKYIYTHEGGLVYEGSWVNGEPNGIGKFIYKNGDLFEGLFLNGAANGKGKYLYNNGDIFEGEYKDNRRNGKGIFHYADGSIHKGFFENQERNGFFIEEDKEGNRFEGNYVEGKRNGSFVEKDKNGNITAQGKYINGQRKEN